jgi:hypothetical protein
MIQMRVQHTPLCYQELHAVSVADIETGERLIMEGINYEFRCHHAHSVLGTLIAQYSSFEPEKMGKGCDDTLCDSLRTRSSSPRALVDYRNDEDYLRKRAFEIVHRASVFSDTPFLFKPDFIALAVLAISSGSVSKGGCMGKKFQTFLSQQAPASDENDFIKSVQEVIANLVECTEMDLKRKRRGSRDAVEARTGDLCKILHKLADIRVHRKMLRRQLFSPLKRTRDLAMDFPPPRELHARKYAKITPTGDRVRMC